MSLIKLVAIALIILGAVGLAYGGFSYTSESTAAKVGSVELKIQEREWVNIPVWAGAGAVVLGGALLFVGNKSA